MKNTKFFVSTLIAAAAMTATAYSADDSETILINFASQSEGQGDTTWGTWNEIETVKNNSAAVFTESNLPLVDVSGEATSAKLSYSAKNTWVDDASGILKGYLDDGNGTGVSISVTTSFLVADVTIYCSTDTNGKEFSAKQVNGVFYTYSADGETIVGNDAWGASGNASIEEGVNALTVSGVSAGLISIYSPGANSGDRGCVAALKIVDAYTGTSTSVNLGGTVDWTDSKIGDNVPWTNSTAEAGTYAAFNLTADTTVSVSGEGITTDAITASGSGDLTLSGNAITLIGPGTIRADDATSVVVNTGVVFSGQACVVGDVLFNKDVSMSSSILSITGNLQLGSDATLTTNELEKGSHDFSAVSGTGTIVYNTVTGNPGYNGNVKVKLSDDFSGDFVVNKNIWLSFAKKDSYFGNATIVLSGSALLHSTQTVDLANDIRMDGSAEIWADSSGAKVTLSGVISGEGTLIRKGAGSMTFSGEIKDLKYLSLESGSTTMTGNATITEKLELKTGGNLTIGSVEGALSPEVTAKQVQIHNSNASSAETLTINSGVLNITSDDKTQETTSGVVIGHWPSGGENVALILNGGVVNAKETYTTVSWDSQGRLDINGGEYNTYGIALGGATNNGRSNNATVNLAGGRLNLGAGGITNNANSDTGKTFNFSGGVLGAFDNWSSAVSMNLSNTVTINTENADVAGTGCVVNLSGVLSDATDANGSIKKTGAGTLTLSGANTYSGGTTIEAGTLVAASANALGSGNVTMCGGKLQVACDATAGVLQLNSSSVSLDLDGVLSLEKMTVGNTMPTSVSIDFGTTGKITTTQELNFGTSVTEFTFTLTLTEDQLNDLNSGKDVSREILLGSGNHGIWNFVDHGEKTISITNWENSAGYVGAVASIDELEAGQWGYISFDGNAANVADSVTFVMAGIPEPSAFGLLAGVGALALVVSRRRRVKKA